MPGHDALLHGVLFLNWRLQRWLSWRQTELLCVSRLRQLSLHLGLHILNLVIWETFVVDVLLLFTWLVPTLTLEVLICSFKCRLNHFFLLLNFRSLIRRIGITWIDVCLRIIWINRSRSKSWSWWWRIWCFKRRIFPNIPSYRIIIADTRFPVIIVKYFIEFTMQAFIFKLILIWFRVLILRNLNRVVLVGSPFSFLPLVLWQRWIINLSSNWVHRHDWNGSSQVVRCEFDSLLLHFVCQTVHGPLFVCLLLWNDLLSCLSLNLLNLPEFFLYFRTTTGLFRAFRLLRIWHLDFAFPAGILLRWAVLFMHVFLQVGGHLHVWGLQIRRYQRFLFWVESRVQQLLLQGFSRLSFRFSEGTAGHCGWTNYRLGVGRGQRLQRRAECLVWHHLLIAGFGGVLV